MDQKWADTSILLVGIGVAYRQPIGAAEPLEIVKARRSPTPTSTYIAIAPIRWEFGVEEKTHLV